MRKARMGKIETRAFEACGKIREWGTAEFNVEWRKSSTWGRVAVIVWRGEKAAEASGCGYDKLSAVLAYFLKHLCPGSELLGAGSGLSTIQADLEKLGWTLVQTYNGKHEDGFRITRNNEE